MGYVSNGSTCIYTCGRDFQHRSDEIGLSFRINLVPKGKSPGFTTRPFCSRLESHVLLLVLFWLGAHTIATLHNSRPEKQASKHENRMSMYVLPWLLLAPDRLIHTNDRVMCCDAALRACVYHHADIWHNTLQVDVGRVWLTFSSCLLAFVFVFGVK